METDITKPEQVELDAERQRKAKEYARIRRRLSFVSMGIGVAGILIFLFTNLGIWLKDQLQVLSCQPISGLFSWQVLVFFLIFIIGLGVLPRPIGYYHRFILPHRYGLSTMTLKGWLG